MGHRGKFISFEGGEGCGKSTHIERIASRLRREGLEVIIVREPGGTPIGEQIRHILQYSRQSVGMSPETELLLFCASRAQLVREIIEPALRIGKIVFADRFLDSTTVYQGVGRKLSSERVRLLNQFATGTCVPDLTIIIDLDPRIGLERVRGRELFDRMENESLEFYQHVRQGYLELARQEPSRIKVVDGQHTIDHVQEQIWKVIAGVL